MSLAQQSGQFFPTSVQVTVHQARDLRAKGKNGSNDAYAIISVAKDKFSTSVVEKTTAPVWKEEASFDLPLFHPGNVERCTLYVTVMHRAQVGLDKFLGQAVVNLLDLHDDKSRKKLDWFKLVDKAGKQDKDRGEVLLDIQFLRNNMSASMFDLSMQDKPRSRISKLKDKVRGKKKDGFSDSASAIVPPVSQVLTDSEGEADAQSLNMSPGVKKKSKLKTLFAPKSNLHRNISQSLSTLGTLPEKNSSLSGSRSSGLNIDSPEVKKKFKFLGHKRSGSSDSKASHGPFSLLNRSKQNNSDQNSLCINGSHVYAEENEPKSGSTLSLNSSGQGSVEDVRRQTSDFFSDPFQTSSIPAARNEVPDRSLQEQQHHQEEQERRQAEERRIAAARKQEEEEKYRAELERLREEEERRLQEEQERKKRFLEDEARRKEEEERRKAEEAAESRRLEEERRQAEERKRQEEASMSDRLTSLFGMIRKKEEKKEEVQQETKEKHQHSDTAEPSQTSSHFSSNPFEDISLSSESPFGTYENQKSSLNQQTPSSTVFPNRTAKVSAVKPRPHPVKPLSSAETQHPFGTPAGRDTKIWDATAGRIKAGDSVEAGPYTQLTQEELITLVVKQQTDLSIRDAKIAELEEYIDNLLVRVIEEKPAILQALKSPKPI
ncbi:rab11 family-interacting protein 1 isoform X2 [Salarias fasciatus]|uniref:Rab11 family-interacting protein 1-like n=1 Tax=Salarias fasciatus TaxID=181472 RepID=A0A672H4H8_SALFA|nr:rab11 family-interacting protein 1-like isoform X2 [Salarias fasciatus]